MFHYAVPVASDLVADLVSNLAFDQFVRVCDQLATFLSRKQVADRFELELSGTCLRLDSVMEFGLYEQ